MGILPPSLSSIKLAFLLSLSFAASSSQFHSLSSPKPSTSPSRFFLKPFSKPNSQPTKPKASASDLLSLLGTPQQASSINTHEAQQLRSCFKFLVPFCPTQSGPEPVIRSARRTLGSWPDFRRKGEDELVWWPPAPVMELARLAVDSGGDPAAIQLALDPTIIPVPDIEGLTPLVSSVWSPAKLGNGSIVCAASKHANNRPLTGVVFEPFEEVKKELKLVPTLPQDSLARQKYSDDSESVINQQINVEYNVSYVYHAMFAYFDRDNVALKGLAKFFKESSAEEREHAEKFMEYQNKRGGKVKLLSIVMPVSDFEHAEKGDALYAMELALSLEKLTNEKLLHLHEVAIRNNDVQLADFVESEFLAEQVEAIKKISEYVAQLRRVGKGHGVWHFDQMLLHKGAAA